LFQPERLRFQRFGHRLTRDGFHRLSAEDE
jgi:hypothetical protein